jgi:hypothetical protein
MSYYIDIIDTTSPLTKLVIEQASASGIVLEWSGGDSKDEMTIVASNFRFDMLTTTAADAAFIGYFTGDEHQFKLLIKNSVDDAVVWQGYILPDLYAEPYKNGAFFVSFGATDGLGRLKGKFLSDEFYSREKSLIAIYVEILKLTGLEMDLYFAAAIENYTNKDWHSIYIDTATFAENGKKQDAYSILDTLLHDTLCVCYQADNRWYIEGINMRQKRQVNYKIYDTAGSLFGSLNYDRLLKAITPLLTPTITMIPPYNEITVSHEKTEPSLPKTLSEEVNEGWAIVTGVLGKIHASSWMANGGLYAWCEKPDYSCVVYNQYYFDGSLQNVPVQDDTRFVSLKEKVFVTKSQKIKFDLQFKIRKFNDSIEPPTDLTLWQNPFKYEIIFNGAVLYSNFGGTVADQEKVIFEKSEEAQVAIEHIFTEEGLLDFRIYNAPGSVFTHKILGIELSKIEISVIKFKEEEVVTDLINGDFTIDKELVLTYGNDQSGASRGFRLAKLKESSSFFNEIEVPILYGFELDLKKYAVVQLTGANLINQNKYTVYKAGALVTVLAVHYNFNDGEQMVVETDVLHGSGSFIVKKYAVDDVLSARGNWTQWTDAIYKIENTSYPKTIANIYRRIFNDAAEKIDLTALNAVKFNDIINFHYQYVKEFHVLNASWNLDENKTTLTLGRSVYKDAAATTPGDDNIPPIVLSGDDIYLTNTQTTASLVATAFDPDGYIASQFWTKTYGGFGDSIDSPSTLTTTLQGLTEDFYTYKIQVTDNDGAAAEDSLNIIRIKDYTVTVDFIEDLAPQLGWDVSVIKKYKLDISPALQPSFILNFKGVVDLLNMVDTTVGDQGDVRCEIYKNGAQIESLTTGPGQITYPLTLNFIASDVVEFILKTSALAGDSLGGTGTVSATVKINTAEFINAPGTFVGLPVIKTQTIILN